MLSTYQTLLFSTVQIKSRSSNKSHQHLLLEVSFPLFFVLFFFFCNIKQQQYKKENENKTETKETHQTIQNIFYGEIQHRKEEEEEEKTKCGQLIVHKGKAELAKRKMTKVFRKKRV